MDIRLNAAIDRRAVAATLKARRRAIVADIFPGEVAGRIHAWLAEETPWSFTCFDGRAMIVPHAQLDGVSPAAWRDLQRRIYQRASRAFAYAYHVYTLGEPEPMQRKGTAVEAFFDFLNSRPMLSFIRAVTGEEDITCADAQATRFGPGQFLGLHNDLEPRHDRRVAYVFQLTPDWRPDWGGELVFPDGATGRAEAFLPAFNRLHLFRVPQDHYVNMVAPYAGGYRYAISGWFKA